ncbi:uncharacterized protein LOC115964376 [Quercus lobata]|uniref:uncharacterized protein LOC115964376 n=1 Tax=Quercus lobata TaxID=97700 RepID=UPI001248809D|nr:uncharacterized protein LOC115964376 [Quercus lobata]
MPKNDEPDIVFSERDSHGNKQPHDNLLMKLDKKRIGPFTSPLVSFTRDRIVPRGIITLIVIAGTYPTQVTKEIDFLIVDYPLTYNIILGRLALNNLKAVTSTYHLKVKFPTAYRVGEIKGDQVLARVFYQAALALGENHTWVINEPKPIPKPSKTPQEVEIVLRDSTKVLKIGTTLLALEKEKMISFLRANQDVFAWKHNDIPRIDRKIIQYHLNVNPECKPLQQKWRIFAPECNKVVTEEVDKLLEDDFIREVFYPDWLANVVMILMDEDNQEKTSFVTSEGLYYYTIMPFGLKNAGAIYQRLVNRMFSHQIGRNVEINVDDMLENFWDSWCPNGGIDANPDKEKAIIEVESPKTVKEVQSLTGKVAALNRFVSRATDKCMPFFKLLKKTFQWNDECEEALAKLKEYLMKPPLLSP